MQSEDSGSGAGQAQQTEQDLQTKTLKWLLEQEHTEPTDSLFKLVQEAYGDAELTEREAAMAGREMMGGNPSADDLSAFVGEEIVLSGESGSDIYGGSRPRESGDNAQAQPPGYVTIDHRRRTGQRGEDVPALDEGVDILGLAENDDIGAVPVALQRNRANVGKPEVQEPETQEKAEPETREEAAPANGVPYQAAVTDALRPEAGEPGGDGETSLAEEPEPAREGVSPPSFDDYLGDDSAGLDEDLGADFSDIDLALPDNAEPAGGDLGAFEAPDAGEEAEASDEWLVSEVARFAAEDVSGSLEDALEDDSGYSAAVQLEEIALEGSEDLAAEDDMAPLAEPAPPLEATLETRPPVPSEEGVAEAESDAGEADDVLAYVSRHIPPADDRDFDRYLLQGKHLAANASDFDSLAVERTEGVVSVDPFLDTDLDYHQDFRLPADFNPQTLAVLTRVVAPAMEHLSGSVEVRLAELELPPESVALDAMLATDPYSSRQCVEEGYAPIIEVCALVPPALKDLGRAEREALRVRLVFRDSGEPCNDLFQEGFVPTDEAAEAESPDGPWLSLPAGGHGASFDFNLGASATDSFAVAVESANDAGEPEPEPEIEVKAETELAEDPGLEVVAEFGEPEEPAEQTVPDEVVGDLDDWLGRDSTDDTGLLELLTEAESALPEEELPDAPPEESAEAFAAGETGQSEPAASQAEPETVDILSEDELDDWEQDPVPAPDTDVDALIDSLGDTEADIDDICGVSVEEFDLAPVADQTDAGDEPAAEAAALVPDETAPMPEEPEPLLPQGELREELEPPTPDEGQPTGGETSVEVVSESEHTSEPDTASDASWCIPAHIRFNYTSSSGSEVFRDFLDAFLEEGAVELEKLEDAIGQWEGDIDSPAGEDVVPRVLHTLKGIAKGIGLQRYGTLIHNFETLLGGLDKPAAGEEEAYFRIVNAWLDAAVQGFEHIQNTETDVASELPRVEGPAHLAAGAAEMKDNAEVDVERRQADRRQRDRREDDRRTTNKPSLEKQQDKQIADEGAKVLAAQQTIRMSSEAVDHLLNLNNQVQQLGVRASQSTFRSKRAAAELLARLSSVRSHITKIADRALQNVSAQGGRMDTRPDTELDALEMDQYSELQEAASILREAIEDLDDLVHVSSRQTASAESLLKQQATVITTLGTSIRDARVVPVSRLMPGLRRIVRTVGADLGKAVNFRVLNESGKLDRDSHVCCQIILEHMVRNALDHGIEPPEERRGAGKPETGRVSIDVSKDGSDYLIRLSDDGRGMNPDALRETALKRGLDVDVDALSDREALRLIFHKGFSTAARLSEISGRGVGMDIVISELQQIGGDIDIDSTPGEGTTFTVRIPSNVNVNGALLVSAGEVSYAIPLDGLIAVEHVPVDEFYRAITAGEQLRIYDMDCDPAYLATLCQGDKLPDPGSWNSNTLPVMLAGSEERYMAIAVDDVAEALELVIRSLGAQFSQVPGVAGGATTADGQAIVALDLNALVRSIANRELSAVSVEREKSERLLVLVVDDSRTQRMVATSQFDTLGVETVTAENGMVAIDLLNTTHRLPDVVLLDVEMPVKDGIQTLREIRRSPRYQHLPVIMVTSRTGPKHRALAQEAGCNGYMGKPFNFPVLVEQIAQLTGYDLQIH